MNPQLFLVAPMNADIETFVPRLDTVLNALDIAALLLPKGARNDNGYAQFAKAILPVAQAKGCAVLLEDDLVLAKRLKADGVHVTGDLAAVREALSRLKPDMIVGAGNLQSRHDAMEKAEAGADYVFFGPFSGKNHQSALAEASWWANTVEVPAVLSEPQTALADIDPAGCEFVALSDQLWAGSVTDIKILKTFSDRMEAL